MQFANAIMGLVSSRGEDPGARIQLLTHQSSGGARIPQPSHLALPAPEPQQLAPATVPVAGASGVAAADPGLAMLQKSSGEKALVAPVTIPAADVNQVPALQEPETSPGNPRGPKGTGDAVRKVENLVDDIEARGQKAEKGTKKRIP